MKNILTSSALALLLMTGTSFAQSFDDAGTDYTTASVDEWVEDQSNEIVDQVNGFACLMKAVRLDGNANRTYKALVDEEECMGGGGDEQSSSDSRGGDQSTSERVEYADVTMVSRREDTAGAAQEFKMFFESVDGARYLAKGSLSSAPTDDLPFGAWRFSYIAGGTEDDPVTTVLDTSEGGFVDIAEWTGTGNDAGDTGFQITVGNMFDDNGSLAYEAGKVRYNGTDDVATFFGVKNLSGTDEVVAGRASGQYYFRWSINADNFSSGGKTVCLDRSDTWQSVEQYKLFYKNADADEGISAGQAVELQGGFGFTYGDNSDFGWYDNWGIWFSAAYPFEGATREVDITDDDGETVTVTMVPGRLVKKTNTEQALALGDTYLITVWNESNGTWNPSEYSAEYAGNVGAEGTFNLTAIGDATPISGAQKLSDNYFDYSWLQSPDRSSWIQWDGGTSITISTEENVTFDPSIVAGKQFVPLYGTDYSTGNAYGGSTTFFMKGTGDSALTSLEDGVLYQSADATLDAGDTSKGSTNGGWTSIDMIAQEDVDAPNNCDTDDYDGCDHTYTWYSGSQWDASYKAVRGGQAVTIDEPINFSYTHVSNGDDSTNKDRNTHNAAFNYTAVSGFSTPVATQDRDSDGTNDFAPADLDGKKYQLTYNGDWLEGLPYIFIDDAGYEMPMRLVNIRDGVTLTASDQTEYVVKAVAVSETIRETALSNCADIQFDPNSVAGDPIASITAAFASLDFDIEEELPFDIENPTALSAINGVDQYGGLPDLNWGQDFSGATATASCTITHGDNSGCEE